MKKKATRNVRDASSGEYTKASRAVTDPAGTVTEPRARRVASKKKAAKRTTRA